MKLIHIDSQNLDTPSQLDKELEGIFKGEKLMSSEDGADLDSIEGGEVTRYKT